MTPKERAAMQQALEALERASAIMDSHAQQRQDDAITALREALGNSLKPKCFADYQPNHAIDRACASCPVAAECQTGEQVEQEPVAVVDPFYIRQLDDELELGTKLYAAPVRTKDLTDDEIWKELTAIQASSIKRSWLSFARAVIAADRRKNK